MEKAAIIKSLRKVQLSAMIMHEEATELLRNMEGVSTPSLRKGLSNQQRKDILRKRRERLIK
jgi:hypothetical protein